VTWLLTTGRGVRALRPAKATPGQRLLLLRPWLSCGPATTTFEAMRTSLHAALAATCAASAVALYTCPPAAQPLAKKFQGSWTLTTGGVDFTTENTYWTAAAFGNVVDTYFCLTNTSETSPGVAQLNIGSLTSGSSQSLLSCAQLDITKAPSSINFHISWDPTGCPAQDGGAYEDYKGWAPAGRSAPACPSAAPLVPPSMVGRGSVVPLGYKANSFLSVDGSSWSLVNEGALVTAWCASKVAAKPAGVTELQFCNNPAGSQFCVQPLSTAPEQPPPPQQQQRRQLQFGPQIFGGPGHGCVWVRKRSPKELEFKWGAYSMVGVAFCPTNMTGSHVMPFNFSEGHFPL
jgi:hypothetical protein